MTATFETIVIGSNAVQIADTGSGPILLSNLDSANTIYLSAVQGFDTTTPSNAGTVPPLGSVTIVPGGTIWAKCATGKTAQLQIIPDGDSYTASPVEIAQQILNSGTILVDNPVTLASQSSYTLGAGVQATIFGPTDVRTFQSWAFGWIPNPLGVGGATPYFRAVFQWYSDAAGTNIVWQEDWILPAVPTNWPNLYGQGPMRGSYMSIILISYDSVADNVAFTLVGSSRSIVAASTMRSNGASNSGGFGTDDVLGFYSNGALAAGTTSLEQPLNYYDGKVVVRLRATAATVAANTILLHIKAQPISDYAGFDAYILGFPTVAVGAQTPDTIYEIYLPKRPCTISVQNAGTVNVSVRVFVIADGGKP